MRYNTIAIKHEKEAYPMTRILLLEDDTSLIDGLEYALRKNGFEINTVRTVRGTMECLRESGTYDQLLLDVTLPDGTGFDVCETVRAAGSQIPIIFLTASDEEVNVIRGLDSGADDYITKPFKLGELCSRIRALLRRTGYTAKPVISSGALSIDFAANRVTVDKDTVELTRAEYRLLSLLVRNADRVVNRETILEALWDNTGDFVDDNTLSMYIRRLREKIEPDPSQPQHLITVRRFGYRWMP